MGSESPSRVPAYNLRLGHKKRSAAVFRRLLVIPTNRTPSPSSFFSASTPAGIAGFGASQQSLDLPGHPSLRLFTSCGTNKDSTLSEFSPSAVRPDLARVRATRHAGVTLRPPRCGFSSGSMTVSRNPVGMQIACAGHLPARCECASHGWVPKQETSEAQSPIDRFPSAASFRIQSRGCTGKLRRRSERT